MSFNRKPGSKPKDSSNTPLLGSLERPSHTPYGYQTDPEVNNNRRSVVNEFSASLGQQRSPNSPQPARREESKSHGGDSQVLDIDTSDLISKKQIKTAEQFLADIEQLKLDVITLNGEISTLLEEEGWTHFIFRMICNFIVRPDVALASGAMAFWAIYVSEHKDVAKAINDNNPSVPQTVAIDSGAQAVTVDTFIPLIPWISLAFVLAGTFIIQHRLRHEQNEKKLTRKIEARNRKIIEIHNFYFELLLLVNRDTSSMVYQIYNGRAMAGSAAMQSSFPLMSSSTGLTPIQSSSDRDLYKKIEEKINALANNVPSLDVLNQRLRELATYLSGQFQKSHNDIMEKLGLMNLTFAANTASPNPLLAPYFGNQNAPGNNNNNSNNNNSSMFAPPQGTALQYPRAGGTNNRRDIDDEGDDLGQGNELPGSKDLNRGLLSSPTPTGNKPAYKIPLPGTGGSSSSVLKTLTQPGSGNNKTRPGSDNSPENVNLRPTPLDSSDAGDPSNVPPEGRGRYTIAREAAQHPEMTPRSRALFTAAVDTADKSSYQAKIAQLLPSADSAALVNQLNVEYKLSNANNNQELIDGLAAIIPTLKPQVKPKELTVKHVRAGLALLHFASKMESVADASFNDITSTLSTHANTYDAEAYAKYDINNPDTGMESRAMNKIQNKQMELNKASQQTGTQTYKRQ